MYNKDKQIRFKTSMLRSNLCDYSDAYTINVLMSMYNYNYNYYSDNYSKISGNLLQYCRDQPVLTNDDNVV